MMAFCAVIGWGLLTRQDYRLLGESIFVTVFFSSNVLSSFKHVTSLVLGTAAARRPFVAKTSCYAGSDLHWSLAVPAVKLAIVHEFSSFQNFAALVLFHTDRPGTLH